MTLQYEDIFSIFLSKITDYSFLDYDENFIRGQMVSWLHSSSSSPRLRAKFSEFNLNDEESALSFALKNSLGEQSDYDFVTDVLARAMVIAWLEPEVKNVLLTKQLLTGSEEKFYAQANHLSQLEQMLNTAKTEFKNILRDYGYLNNSYIKE
jgi:hypothetical protein